jgi:hypothetical protein
MSVSNPAYRVRRWSVVGMEGMFAKMFDPPTESPETPDKLNPTNPVPEVMAAAGYQNPPSVPHTVQRDLLHGMKMPTWDGLKQLQFFLFADNDNPTASGGTYPAPTIRMPRGVIFNGETSAKGPPPHTIHWHGIEPTPMNDGVGHCSMELGFYVYKWQPNFIGTYFYHCHRNTEQHFEFGLFGMLLIEPPDAYFATQVLGVPIGHCRDGKRRIATNLATVLDLNGQPLLSPPAFPDFNGNLLTAPDPWDGDPALKFATDPHAMTVAYDVEALWVLDDRDSVWSDLAPDARATYPKHGSVPGVNDNFHGNAGGSVGPNDFFAFNDFNADYWFVTGVPVPAHKGGTATIDPAGPSPAGGGLPGGVIPAALNSGVSGLQIAIKAQTNQTILVRCLDAAYNATEITFPVDIVIIAWDGRALGQPPYGHNAPYLVPAGTPIQTSTARRFDALIRVSDPIDSFATVKFQNTRGMLPGKSPEVLCTAKIPITISAQMSVTLTPDKASPQAVGAPVTFTAAASGGTGPYEYRFYVNDGSGSGFVLQGPYSTVNTLVWSPLAVGHYDIFVEARKAGSSSFRDCYNSIYYYEVKAALPPTGVTLSPNLASPQQPGTPVTFTAAASGGSGGYEYRFYVNDGSGSGFVLQAPYSTASTFVWTPAAAGAYDIFVEARSAGSQVFRDVYAALFAYQVQGAIPPTGVTVTPNLASPQAAGTAITFTAAATGANGPCEYRFYVNDGSGAGYLLKRDYSTANSFTWTPAAPGHFDVFVETRLAGTSAFRDAFAAYYYYSVN